MHRKKKKQTLEQILVNAAGLKIADGKFAAFERMYQASRLSSYNRYTFDFAVAWGRLMQERLSTEIDKVPFGVIAEETSHEADDKGASGAQYVNAIVILGDVWEFGKLLVFWHNSKNGSTRTDAVRNPTQIVYREE